MIDPKRILASSQLPSMPATAMRLLDLARNADSQIADFVAAVNSDPAIAAKILKAANSSYFGMPSKVATVDRAIMLMGTSAVTALALGFSLIDFSSVSPALRQEYATLWLQSAVQAAAAAALGHRLKAGNSDELFMVALLLDIGRLAFLKVIPQEYLSVVKSAEESRLPLHDMELEVLGCNHAEIGAELAQRWKLPEAMQTACRLHHAGLEALAQASETSAGGVVALAAACACVGEVYCGKSKGAALERLHLLGDRFFGMTPEDVARMIDELEPKIQQTASLFALDVNAIPPAGDLIAEANEQLALLAVTAQAESVQARARQQAAEQEIQSLESRQKELLEQTVRDGLTKVFNRRYFDETLKVEVKQCMRDAAALGLVFLDVDRFKQLNDNYGHAVGDKVLACVAERLCQAVRGGDVVARYGGEEFVVLVKHPTEVGLQRLAERIRLAIASSPVQLDGRALEVTVSVGAALMIPTRGQTDAGSVLVEAADQAMYEAKRSGRNCVRMRSVVSEFDRELLRIANRRRFSRWLVSHGGFTMLDVSKGLVACKVNRVRIGELACRAGLLNESAVEHALQEQIASGLRFGETAVRAGLLTVENVGTLLALQQEDPQELANQLVAQGLCTEASMNMLLDAYFNDVVAHPARQLVDA